jgi:hypothetical protein
MQASLALAAPKIQSAEARSRFKFLPTEGGGAAVQSSKFKVQSLSYRFSPIFYTLRVEIY